ncbi:MULTISPECIES: hypothetical protein [unclassified Microbacterium]|uniref:hypothetical protein n=1 Tax=unclassified Microbacterium TaxID=2609290 RepID=UPI0011AF32DE|nr:MULTISPECIES: hypothetical protein [unclassified Microbacterium]
MRFAADFQSMDEQDALTVTFADLLDAPAGAVMLGGRVQLDDLEGHQAEGTVVSVEDDLIDVSVDVTTWREQSLQWLSGWSSSGVTTGWRAGTVSV